MLTCLYSRSHISSCFLFLIPVIAQRRIRATSPGLDIAHEICALNNVLTTQGIGSGFCLADTDS